MLKKILKGSISILLGITLINTLGGNNIILRDKNIGIETAIIDPADCDPESYSSAIRL